jgi:hypothetical protein
MAAKKRMASFGALLFDHKRIKMALPSDPPRLVALSESKGIHAYTNDLGTPVNWRRLENPAASSATEGNNESKDVCFIPTRLVAH